MIRPSAMLFSALSVLMAAGVCSAQHGGSAAGGITGGVTKGGNVNFPNLTTPVNRNPTSMDGFGLPASVYLSGRVMLDDGTAPPIETVIEKFCGSNPIPLGYPDQKGQFSVSIKTDSSISTADASYGNSPAAGGAVNPGRAVNLAGCRVRAALAGYRSDEIDVSSVRVLDNPNIGTIVMYRRSKGQAGTLVSATTLNAPKPALKAFEHGALDLRKGDSADAEKQFTKAVELYPKFASAWFQLGRLAASHDRAQARGYYLKAVEADASFVPPYAEIAGIDVTEHHWQQALESSDHGLRLDSENFPQLFYYNAVANFELQNSSEAEKKAREAIQIDHDHRLPRASELLGYILVKKGDLRGAAEQLRAFLATNPPQPEADKVKAQLASLESQAGAVATASLPASK